MAWTPGLWPVSSSTTALLTAAQELRSNLNAKISHDLCPAISDGDALYTAIANLRYSVNQSIAEFYDPETGKALVPCGADPYWGYGNLWQRLFGSARRAWRNRNDGTEAASPNWFPEMCNLQDSDPYSFLLNELHDIIDAMGWKRLDVNWWLNGLWKAGGTFQQPSEESSQSAALNAAWAAWTAAAAVAVDPASPYFASCHAFYYRARANPPLYDCAFGAVRRFNSFDLPAGAAAVRLVTMGGLTVGLVWLDQYDQDNSGARQTVPNPDWTWSITIGTTNDQTIWDYGAPACQSDLKATWQTILMSNWTAGVTNYIQVRAGDDVRPDHVASNGYWGHGSGDYGSYDKQVLTPGWVLYKVVP